MKHQLDFRRLRTPRHSRSPGNFKPPAEKTRPNSGVLIVRTLGRFEVRDREKALPPPVGRASRLFKLLLCNRNHVASKEHIAEILWPNNVNRARNVHAAAHDVRTWLRCHECLRFEADCYSLAIGEVDADTFESRIRRARSLRSVEPKVALDQYRAATAVYGGPFLPEDSFSEWVVQRRLQLEECFIEAAMFLSAAAFQAKDFHSALDLASMVWELDPGHEDSVRLQMRALASLGRRAEALRRFDRLKLFLDRELQCRPDPMTEADRAELLLVSVARPLENVPRTTIPSR